MEIDLQNSAIRLALIQFTENGTRSNCPFCIGRQIASVSPGERIVFLNAVHAGQQATVSDEPGSSDDEFLVSFDFEPPGQLMRVHYKRDKFAYFPIQEVPNWLCSLSIDDLCAVEHAALQVVLLASGRNGRKRIWSENILLPLLATVRHRRLPVLGADLWMTLASHGVSETLKGDFCKAFDFGVRLLADLHGRPAIQKKRAKAMSIGRYLTPGQEEYFGSSPGIT